MAAHDNMQARQFGPLTPSHGLRFAYEGTAPVSTEENAAIGDRLHEDTRRQFPGGIATIPSRAIGPNRPLDYDQRYSEKPIVGRTAGR